jgi:hypothetical protein
MDFFQVQREIALLPELEVTVWLITPIRLDFIVDKHMLRQVLLLRKPPIANFTLEILLIQVNLVYVASQTKDS